MEILQSAARLSNDGFRVVLDDRQRCADRGDSAHEVAEPVILFAALQGCFSSLQFLFDGGMSADEEECRGIRHP